MGILLGNNTGHQCEKKERTKMVRVLERLVGMVFSCAKKGNENKNTDKATGDPNTLDFVCWLVDGPGPRVDTSDRYPRHRLQQPYPNGGRGNSNRNTSCTVFNSAGSGACGFK